MKKQGKQRRLTSILLTAVMLVLAIPPVEGAAASKPAVYSNMTQSYKDSVYYQRLMEVELTGNQVTDLIAVAASQLGYTEGTNKNDLSGNGHGSGDCTEYGNCLGKNALPWCASFVSWCFRVANIPTSIMPRTAGCGILRSSVYNKGATWHGVDSGYKPKAGDLVMYEKLVKMADGKYYYVYANRDKNGVPDNTSHVGIVVTDFNESKQTYDVIDGNGNQGKVKYLANQKLYMAGPVYGGGTMNRIQGFITPAYTTGSGSGYDGNTGTQKQPLNVTLTKATDPQYTAKEKIEETNAVVVSRVSKPAGSSITSSGIILSAADGSIIKEHTEKVTNVGNSTTVFHAWYDIQDELGITLKPGVTYIYQFCAVVNGETFRGEQYKFKTKGTTPSYTVSFDAAGGSVPSSSKKVTYGEVYGELPVPTRDQYIFRGWYTSKNGGTMVASSTEVKLNGNQTLYAQWEHGEEEEENEENAGSTQESGTSGAASTGGENNSTQTSSSNNSSSTQTTTSDSSSNKTTSGSSGSDVNNTSSKTTSSSDNSTTSSKTTSSKTTSSKTVSISDAYDSSSQSSSSGGNSSSSNSSTGNFFTTRSSYYGTGTWVAGMGGSAWKLRRPDGSYLASQWGMIDGVWYLFRDDGYTCTGWQMVNGTWYYFYPNAAMANGWVFVNNRWYLLDASGAMQIGWQMVAGVWYYMDASGAMLANTITPDGYWVDASGAWIH